jgi:hypothetical protein
MKTFPNLHVQTLICFAIFVFVLMNAQAQHQQSGQSPLNPLFPCCDIGAAEGLSCGGWSSHMDPNYSCVDHSITIRTCIDATRDHSFCLSWHTGCRYCSESVPNGYPRYYALYQPIGVSPGSLSFSATYGGSNPPPQTLSISNNPWIVFGLDYTLNWSASKNQNWLTVSPTSGTVSGSTPTTVTASVNISGLSCGTYSATITVGASQVSSLQWTSIPVTLAVIGPLSVFSL